jgi:hypothetical protein
MRHVSPKSGFAAMMSGAALVADLCRDASQPGDLKGKDSDPNGVKDRGSSQALS